MKNDTSVNNKTIRGHGTDDGDVARVNSRRHAQNHSRYYGLPRGGRRKYHGHAGKKNSIEGTQQEIDKSDDVIVESRLTEAAIIFASENSGVCNSVTELMQHDASVSHYRKPFNPLSISSKYGICGLPLKADTYRGGTCFGCRYCASNCRKVMPTAELLQICDPKSAARLFHRVLVEGIVDPSSFLDVCIAQDLPIHLGSMGDSFQPAEDHVHATREFLAVCHDFGRQTLISTKSDSLRGVTLDPKLDAIQMSVSNTINRFDLEPSVPDIHQRERFFKTLKDAGVRVGIRIQPFLPGVSDRSIIDKFKDADHFTVEGLKLIPQNAEQISLLLDRLGLERSDFKAMGLLNLKPELRLALYWPLLQVLMTNGFSFSVADNDLRAIGNNSCCCGDMLMNKSTSFNTN